MQGGGREARLDIVPKLALNRAWVLPSSTPSDCIPRSDTLKMCLSPYLHWKQSHGWPWVSSSLSGSQPCLHQTIASARNPTDPWLSCFPKQKAHDDCCLAKPRTGWLNHAETTPLLTWMGKVQVLEPSFFPLHTTLTLDIRALRT